MSSGGGKMKDVMQNWLDQWKELGNAKTAASIITNVSFMSLFLAVFFFTIGKTIEREVVVTDARVLVQGLTRDLPMLPAPASQAIQEAVQSIPPPSDEKSPADIAVEENNRKIVLTSLLIMGGAFLLGMILVAIICFVTRNNYTKQKLDWDGVGTPCTSGTGADAACDFWTGKFSERVVWWEVLLENFGILLVIFLVEFTFATLVIKNFRALDPNFAALTAVKEVQSVAKAKCGHVTSDVAHIQNAVQNATHGAAVLSRITTGSQGTGSQGTGSQVAGSQVTGSQVAGSQVAGSQVAGSQVADALSELFNHH
jgi:hypothetical protein